MKRTLVAVALVIVFVMALAAPAFAITHSATYQLDGVINFKKQMGHLCNTGAEIKQTIMGPGVLDKVQSVSMSKGQITMKDSNDGVAGASALTITTVWELCAPPKYMYDGAVVALPAMYNFLDQPYTYYGIAYPLFGPGPFGWTEKMGDNDPNFDEWEAVSSQIWAVQVQADPGYSIGLHQDGRATYGAYRGLVHNLERAMMEEGSLLYGPDDSWTNNTGKWRWEVDEDGVFGPAVGDDFVGVYFTMEQHARTSMGTLKRYIDISSPFTHAYLMEDMSVVGKSDVQETFAMVNAPAGADVPGDWWVLF